MMNNRLLGKVPTPLELVDAGLDSIAEVAQLPARLIQNVAHAAEQGAQGIQQGISKPKDYAQVPAPPDTIIQGGLDAVTGVANGVISGVTGVFKAVQDTGEGVRRQLDSLRK